MKYTLLLLFAVASLAAAQTTQKYRTYIEDRPISNADEVVNVSASALTRVDLPQLRESSTVLTIKKIDSTAFPVVLRTSADFGIDGATSYILTNPNQAVTLQAQGSRWRVLNPPASLEVNLGSPRAVETNRAVTTASMIVGAYTIANQPDIPRNVSVTHTAVSTVDTLGTIVVVGTDYAGDALTETLTPVSGTTVNGTRAFRTITSITGAGWVVAAGADSVVLGYGSLIGLPVQLSGAGTMLGALSTTLAMKVTTGGTLSTSCVTEASGNGSSVLKVWIPR